VISSGVCTDSIRSDSRNHKTLRIYVVLFPAIQFFPYLPGISQVQETLHYIGQQLEHHRTRTFQEEYLAFLKKTRRTFRRKIPLGLGAPDSYRTLRDGSFPGHVSPGTSCQATIGVSLRDALAGHFATAFS